MCTHFASLLRTPYKCSGGEKAVFLLCALTHNATLAAVGQSQHACKVVPVVRQCLGLVDRDFCRKNLAL